MKYYLTVIFIKYNIIINTAIGSARAAPEGCTRGRSPLDTSSRICNEGG